MRITISANWSTEMNRTDYFLLKLEAACDCAMRYLGFADLHTSRALIRSTSPSFTDISLHWVSGLSRFLSPVRMRFWAEKPLSQSAVCTDARDSLDEKTKLLLALFYLRHLFGRHFDQQQADDKLKLKKWHRPRVGNKNFGLEQKRNYSLTK